MHEEHHRRAILHWTDERFHGSLPLDLWPFPQQRRVSENGREPCNRSKRRIGQAKGTGEMDRRLLLQLLATGGALTTAPASVWAAGQTSRGITRHPTPGDQGSLPLSSRESLLAEL